MLIIIFTNFVLLSAMALSYKSGTQQIVMPVMTTMIVIYNIGCLLIRKNK